MRAGLDGPPVVSGGERDRVDAVHHSLVVRAGAVGVGFGEARRLGDAVRHLRSGEAEIRQLLERNVAGRARQPQVRQVGENAQPHPPAADALQERRHAFAHGVDQVGAHRILRIDDEVHDGMHLVAHLDQPHFEVLGPSAARLHRRLQRVRGCEDLLARAEDRRPRRLGVGQLGHLHLADHPRLVGVG